MKKNIIIINGSMGVGKTTVCKALNKNLENSAWLDGDWCWQMQPFNPNEENKKMVEDNIHHLLLNYCINSSVEHIIFSWVIPSEKLLKKILSWFSDQACNIHIITLMASKDTLSNRIIKDVSVGDRTPDMVASSIKKQALYHRMDTLKINTSHRSVEDLVDQILNIIK